LKRALIILVVALPFLISFVFLIAVSRQVPVDDSPLPTPNGYDKFIEAAGMLHGDPRLYSTMSGAELAAVVATNAGALALVHSAFTNECRVPVEYSLAYCSAHENDLTAIEDLAQTLAAEGRMAETCNHPAEAAKDFLDIIRLGIESGRGGFLTDSIIGSSIEALGKTTLKLR
jgi:hypothetical protein